LGGPTRFFLVRGDAPRGGDVPPHAFAAARNIVWAPLFIVEGEKD